MSTIYDYMDWRGDLSFAQDPLNIVDNVILSNLTYLDMKSSFVEDGGGGTHDIDGDGDLEPCLARHGREAALPLKTVAERFFAEHSAEEIADWGRPFREVPELVRQMAQSVRFGSISISDYVNVLDREAEEQPCALVFWLDEVTAYAAFEGTDSSFIGWKEDFGLSYLNEIPAQRHAVEFLNMAFAEKCPRTLYVGGHSKGGNLAVYASAFCDEAIRERIVKVYSNDGPGFRPEIANSHAYQALLPKVTGILPDSSLIGGLLDSRALTLIIRSTVSGFGQHDAFTWEVLGTRFVASVRTESGRFYDQVLRLWLTRVSDYERKLFTDTLFDLLEAGADTVAEFKADPLRASLEMIKASQKIKPKTRAELSEILRQLAASGADTVFTVFNKDRDR